jgi:hypothetical protein
VIAAGLILIAIGAADLLREFLPARGRWIGLLAGAAVIVALAAFADAIVAGLVAVVLAAGWVWLAPVGGRSRAGFWPAVALAVVVAVLVAAYPARAGAGLIERVWQLATPVAGTPLDEALLAVGAVLFLLESANVVVRAALTQEDVQVATDVTADAADAEASPAAAVTTLKGGRLIGPLERLLVFALTLAAIYPLLAAILAAKGIVRFPEISRDSEAGNRAEYFLIGSLVSWVIALAAAFLVWWAFQTQVR